MPKIQFCREQRKVSKWQFCHFASLLSAHFIPFCKNGERGAEIYMKFLLLLSALAHTQKQIASFSRESSWSSFLVVVVLLRFFTTLFAHSSSRNFFVSFQVYLHAEESWAETASHSHWMVKSCWWRPKSRLVVEEVMGTKRYHFFALCIT